MIEQQYESNKNMCTSVINLIIYLSPFLGYPYWKLKIMSKRTWLACEQSRVFNEKWEQEFFVVLNSDKASVSCLICGKSIAGLKRSNLQRHFKSTHEKFCDSPVDSLSRLAKLSDLKSKRGTQTKCLTGASTLKNNLSEASLRITELICKNKRPFSDGEYIKKAAITLVDTVLRDDANKAKVVKKLSEVPLSRHTVTRRTEDISQDLKSQLISDIMNCDYCSIAMDESTDVTDVSQLCIYIRLVKDLEAKEDLLTLIPLEGRTTGEIISQATIDYLEKVKFPFQKVVGITTDGAPAMTGHHSGCVALLKKSGLFPNLKFGLHCIIHQESLCSKSATLHNVMDFVQKTVNFIRKKSALIHRQFRELLLETDSVAKDVLLHSEVRWLSRSVVLDRFCDVLPEIISFLQLKGKNTELICNPQFQADLMFLADISSHLASLNKSLQGKGHLVTDLVSAVSAFKAKLSVFKADVSGSKAFFPRLKGLGNEFNPNTDEYSKVLCDLESEFSNRFIDIQLLQPIFSFLLNPFIDEPLALCNILEPYCEADLPSLLTEITNLQSSIIIRSQYGSEKTLLDFWRLVPATSFSHLCGIASRIVALWGSTYCCESTFSTMKYVKSKYRSAMSNEHLEGLLRIACTSRTPEYEKIVTEKQAHASH